MAKCCDPITESAVPGGEPIPPLRLRAETVLDSLDLPDTASLSPAEIQHLLHELRVHQVELEIQNEELRQPQETLEATKARYWDLYNLAPTTCLVFSMTSSTSPRSSQAE